MQETEYTSLVLVVTSVRERRNQPFIDAAARDASGAIYLRIPLESLDPQTEFKPGIWRLKGDFDNRERSLFTVAHYEPVTTEDYRSHHNAEPRLPRAFTFDIETLTLPDFRERVGSQLERMIRLGSMRFEQQQRYLEDIAAEEERCYALGSLSATSGRVLSIALHVGPIPGSELSALDQKQSEHVFGIGADGFEQNEKKSLLEFLSFMKDFDVESDELVGHNIVGFDLPFIFQRCVVNEIKVRPFVNLADYNVRGVFDTMQRWWLGAKRTVSLDDLAWALGIVSSKTSEVEGSKVFELYQEGKLEVIREYNLNDVRVTRKIYERMVNSFGRS